jgi:uncharacterized membrane protein
VAVIAIVRPFLLTLSVLLTGAAIVVATRRLIATHGHEGEEIRRYRMTRIAVILLALIVPVNVFLVGRVADSIVAALSFALLVMGGLCLHQGEANR